MVGVSFGSVTGDPMRPPDVVEVELRVAGSRALTVGGGRDVDVEDVEAEERVAAGALGQRARPVGELSRK